MNILIKAGEYLFTSQGTHLCDSKGFAIRASEDTECDIEEAHFERVREMVIADRSFRGLDEDGNAIVTEPVIEDEIQDPPVEP